MLRFLSLLVIAIALPSSAAADGFDALIEGAETARTRGAIGAIVWPDLVDCKRAPAGHERKQCRGMKAALAGKSARTRYYLTPPKALFAGEYSAKKSALLLVLHGCIDCETGIEVSGRSYLVSSGKVRRVGNAILGPVLDRKTIALESAEVAARWKAETLPRLVTEFIVERAPKLPKWFMGDKSGSKSGVSFKVVGYRVYDPCDGSVLMSKPKVARVAPDKAACGR